ncbi:MAG: vitamin B12-dependent ribonucleotide reductase, partial [Candidatus Nanopelagicales bacterium]|nr:vitamin B12-dependent ribonucleotide reductase [Candidatus Nanopelagicales bacterium]
LRSSGGTASGPVSFMRGADASAGTIKSGGATRRAAKMVVLDVDHPDIEEFIETKLREEEKIRVLRDAGFDMDLGGKDISSVQYQNANNSVRVSDEFMRAVEGGGEFSLRGRTNGEVIETVDARKLFDKLSEAAWACADPRIHYDDTINDWHTNAESGRITASNPCFTGDTLVATDRGLIAFKELIARTNAGEQFQVWTHDATNPDEPREATVLSSPDAFMITGVNPIVRLRFSNGMEVRCTPGHKLFTENRGYVAAEELTDDDLVRTVNIPTPAINASWHLPVDETVRARGHRESVSAVSLPEEWSVELGHYIGWLVGDGCTSSGIVSTIYGSVDDRQEVLPRHLELVAQLNGGRAPKVSEQANGTAQLRLTRRVHHRWVSEIGVRPVKAAAKRAPFSIFQAPPEVLAAFLQGLFDADGTVIADRDRGAYVGLGSASRELLQDVQRLLTTFGIFSRIYNGPGESAEGAFSHTRKDGTTVTYGKSASYDLRISGESVDRFAAEIGFSLSRKQGLLRDLVSGRVKGAYRTTTSVRLVERTDEGHELTYNLSEPRNHSYTANGLVVRNCSEYMSLDNSSCNLASLNLLKFLRDDGTFDADRFARAVEFVITAMDISICFADFPTESIGETTRRFRQLGIGYANLGALLMACGLAYDSEAGRAFAAAITSLMTGTAYRRLAELAGVVGPYEGYALNASSHSRVMRKHAAATDEVRSVGSLDGDVLAVATTAWADCLRIGEANGWRNAQASVLAPTGTIGFMMDCDTTGIEPDFSLVKFKKLVGGGSMQIVNQTVPRALRRLGYPEETVEAIIEHIGEHGDVVDAPGLKPEHYSVFDCAMGSRSITPMGHVRMMAAVQPFLSGAISKTVNMPESAAVVDVRELYLAGWKMGLKALAIYRDNCKVGQPLSEGKNGPKAAEEEPEPRPVRKRLPKSRPARTVSFSVGGAEGYMTASSYPDNGLGEIFLKMSKQGSTLAGMMDAFSIAISIGLQYGVPLEQFVQKFTNMRFEPSGLTDDSDIRMAQSIMDYIFRRLALDFLPFEVRESMGIFTADEREAQVSGSAYEPGRATELPPGSPAEPGAAGAPPAGAPPAGVHSSMELLEALRGKAADAPLCFSCGIKMRPSGSCYVCEGCGSTSGCS